MQAHGCPKCHALHGLLIEAEPDVVRRGVEARARGAEWGVLVAIPEELRGETEEELAALAAAGERGFYVGVMSVRDLIRMVPDEGHDPEALTDIVRQLRGPAPEGQVHVLGTLDGCVATVTARADPEMAAARDREETRLTRIGELLAMAEPWVRSKAAERAQPVGRLFVVVERDDPMATRLGGVSPVEGAHVGLYTAVNVLAALPLEGLEHEDAMRAMKRLTSPIPDGSVRVVAVFDGHITTVTTKPGPRCLAIK